MTRKDIYLEISRCIIWNFVLVLMCVYSFIIIGLLVDNRQVYLYYHKKKQGKRAHSFVYEAYSLCNLQSVVWLLTRFYEVVTGLQITKEVADEDVDDSTETLK